MKEPDNTKLKNAIVFLNGLTQADRFGYIQSEDLSCGTGERSRSQKNHVLV